jgi:hypothetical protein
LKERKRERKGRGQAGKRSEQEGLCKILSSNPNHHISFNLSPQIWTEVQSGIGAVNFITGSGGFLQALVFGYGGLRLHPEVLEVRDTFLPANTTQLSLRSVDYLGSSLDLVFTEREMNVTLIEAGAELNLTLEYADGSKVELETEGKRIEWM